MRLRRWLRLRLSVEVRYRRSIMRRVIVRVRVSALTRKAICCPLSAAPPIPVVPCPQQRSTLLGGPASLAGSLLLLHLLSC